MIPSTSSTRRGAAQTIYAHQRQERSGPNGLDVSGARVTSPKGFAMIVAALREAKVGAEGYNAQEGALRIEGKMERLEMLSFTLNQPFSPQLTGHRCTAGQGSYVESYKYITVRGF